MNGHPRNHCSIQVSANRPVYIQSWFQFLISVKLLVKVNFTRKLDQMEVTSSNHYKP